MNIEIELVKKEEKEILKNLLEKYSYEFSQWENNDVNDIGLYEYNYLDNELVRQPDWLSPKSCKMLRILRF
ncbi:MAG: hypothetical protein LBC53_07495 [Spirochaetaceae bacterium]|jgi:hypothetical protein|nr:hypothetical protein [Spirochaetaceae bacterium]